LVNRTTFFNPIADVRMKNRICSKKSIIFSDMRNSFSSKVIVSTTFFLRIFLVIVFMCSVASSATPQDKIQFLSGVILLEKQTDLPGSVRVRKYLELQKLTGVSNNEGIAFVEKYRSNPEAWKKIEDSMLKTVQHKDTTKSTK